MSTSRDKPPAAATPRNFEDLPVGWSMRFGPCSLSADEIIAFAAQYDPQYFHLDEVAARDSLLEGLSASGWHGCALAARMAYDAFLGAADWRGSPGVDSIDWLKPLRPDTPFYLQGVVLDHVLDAERRDVGFVRFQFDLVDEGGEAILREIQVHAFGHRREGAAS